MATLHVVSGTDALPRCRDLAAADDAVLLIGAAVAQAGAGLIALTDGLDEAQRSRLRESGCETVDYDGFVALVTQHHPIVSWR